MFLSENNFARSYYVFSRLWYKIKLLTGHRGKWCHENCNPWSDPSLKGINTPVCEQLFSWANKYPQVKSMNEPRFQVGTYTNTKYNLIPLFFFSSFGCTIWSHTTFTLRKE